MHLPEETSAADGPTHIINRDLPGRIRTFMGDVRITQSVRPEDVLKRTVDWLCVDL